MTLRTIILTALLALASPAPALAAWACLPSPPMPLVSWTDMARVIKEPTGNYVVSWWCPVTVDGVAKLRVEQFIVLGKYVDLPKFGAATARVLSAPDSLAAAIGELDAAKVIPAPGSMEMYDAMRLQYLGCLGLVQSTPADTFLAPLPANFCGAEPVPPPPPPPPTTQYTVTVTVAYPLKADGTRSITRWPVPAIVGEPADGSVQILQFGARFCKVPRLSTATQTVVAGCVVKP